MWRGKERLGLARLDHVAILHHQHPVAHGTHHMQVVADKQIGQPIFHLQIAQEIDDLHLHGHVERTRRLVQHHQLGPQDHRAGNRDTLTLTAREFMRVAVHRGGVQPDLFHHLGHQNARRSPPRIAMHAQTFGDDLRGSHARAQTSERVLKHDLHLGAVLAQFSRRPAVHILPDKADLTFRGNQPHDRQRQRRLARAGLADDAQGFARPHAERGGIDCLHMPHGAFQKPLLDREPDPQILRFSHHLRPLGHRSRKAHRPCAEQLAGVLMLRRGKDICHRPALDNLAILHHTDPVGDALHDPQIMRDEQKTHAFFALQLRQKLQNLRLNGHIERRCRLIGNQDVGFVGQRHGDHHPLPLSTGQLMRIGPQTACRLANPHPLQQFHDARLGRHTGQPLVQLQALTQLLFQRMQRVKRCHRFLKDKADVVAAHLAQPPIIRANHFLAIVDHRSRDLCRRSQQRHGRERRNRFARATLAHNRHGFPTIKAERHAFDRRNHQPVLPKTDPQVLDL
ncbi:hypothetical protein ROS217_12206 [Roseovarius sp. 217]|nr:hypothetical protein ROS217_12206 [Roseovarius sp. 217]